MIKKISIFNFYSIGETQEISLEITPKDMLDDSARKILSSRLNLVSCFIGHNASGKTKILKALTFLFWLVNDSYTSTKSEDRIPYEPHKLLADKPSCISIQFFDNQTLYEYLVEFDQEKILKEQLRKKMTRMTTVFELTRDTEHTDIKTSHLKLNKVDEARFKERGNVTLLSCLINTGYLSEITYFKKISSNVNKAGLIPLPNIARYEFPSTFQKMHDDQPLSKEIFDFIKTIDLGITDFKFEKSSSMLPLVLMCIHETENGNFSLPAFDESTGTQNSIVLLLKILQTLKNGGLMVIDEIEFGLHPTIVRKLISLFENKETNPRHAQLLFSTHQHLLINDRTKTQIFIVEKNDTALESEVYRLDEVEGVRNDENYFQHYISGAYGGTPKLSWI